MASPKLYAEIWKRPGHATFGKVIADVPVITCSGTTVVNGIGEGRITIPKNYSRVDEILKSDATTPANAVSSLVRVFSERSTVPIFEFIPIQFTGEQDKADPDIEISGPAIDSIWGHARLEAWDWTGADDEQSDWPDWIWGGKNILGALEASYKPAVVFFYTSATSGTFTIGISFNSGAITNTAAIAFNASAATVDSALTAAMVAMGLTSPSVLVSGAGTVADPWQVQTVTPLGTYVFSTNSGSLVGGLMIQDRVSIGAVLPAGWTVSFNPVNNLPHGQVDEFRITDFTGSDPAAPACDTTGFGIMFNGGVGGLAYPGIQKIVTVKPGGRYYAHVTAYAQGSTTSGRLVIRDLFENCIAADVDCDSGKTLTANTWIDFDVPLVEIPTDVDRVIFRFADVAGGNAPPIFVACMELREGMPPDTWGEYLTQLYLDATSDHAPGRVVWEAGTTNLPYLSLDFSPTVDTNGNAYTDQEVAITLKRGQNYLRVLSEAYKMGYEGRIVPNNVATGTYKLQFYNTQGMKVDYSLVANGPSIQGGRDVTRRDLRRFMPSSTNMAVEGGEQNIARAENASAVTALGRIEAYQPNQDLGTLVEASTVADQSLAQSLSRSQSLTYILTPSYTDPQPFIDYRAGDVIYVMDPPAVATREARRIKSLQFTFTKETVQYTVQLESESYAGVGPALTSAVDFLMKEFKAIREEPLATDSLNYFPAGGTGTPTVVLAAYNATQTSKDKADFVCTGTSDEGLFNIALSILSASLNNQTGSISGRVVLTEGDYYLGTTIDLHRGVRFEGMGIDATNLHSAFSSALATATNATMFNIDHTPSIGSTEAISFSHLSMNGHKAIQSSGSPHGIYIEPNGNAVIALTDVDIHSFRGSGLVGDRCADKVFITRSFFSLNTGDGVNLSVEGEFFMTNSYSFSNGGIGVKGNGSNLKLVGCIIRDNTSHGFSTGGIFEDRPKTIIGNEILGNDGYGIELDGVNAVVSNNYIVSNSLDGIIAYGNQPLAIVGNLIASNTLRGATLVGGAGNQGGVFEGNVVRLNGQHGIYVGSDDWTVQGNRVNNNGRTTTNTYDGIHVAAGVDSSILNNMVRQTIAGNVQRYGINITAGATGTWRAGNDCRGGGWGTAAYVDAGAASILVWAGGFGDNQ